jgi:hypothetical protein
MRAGSVSIERSNARMYTPEQRDSAQHASRSTALSVPLSDPHLCSRHRCRQRSCRRQSPRWLGQWRGVGQQGVGAGSVADVQDVGAEAERWAGQHQQRADVLLSLHGDAG